MDQIKILKRALHISWKYRTLWLIGLVLVLAGGGVMGGFSGGGGAPGGGGRSRGNGWDNGPWRQSYDLPEEWFELWSKVGPILVAVGAVLLTLLVLGIAVGIVKVVARYVTRSSLIQMVEQYEVTGEKLGFWSGLRLGWSKSALRLFLISLVLKLPLALLMMVSIGALVTLATLSFITETGAMIALGVMLVMLVIPVVLLGAAVGAVLGPVTQLSYRFCALEGYGAWSAIKAAVGLIRRNLGATALQWLLLVGLRIGWGIVLIPINLLLVVLGVFVGGLPALLFGGVGALVAGPALGIGVGLVSMVVALIVLVGLPNVVLTTVATVFHSTTWTLAYRELEAIDAGEPEEEEDES